MNDRISSAFGIFTSRLTSLALFIDQAGQTMLDPVKQGRKVLLDGAACFDYPFWTTEAYTVVILLSVLI